jgi:hypothetical protein
VAWVVVAMLDKVVHKQDMMQEQTVAVAEAELIIQMHIEAAMADQALW